MTLDDLRFAVAPANGARRRLVIALAGTGAELFRDELVINSAPGRKRFFSALAERCGLPADQLTTRFDAELPRLADEVDRAAGEAAAAAAQEDDPFEASRRAWDETPAEVSAEAERMARNPNLLREVYEDLTALGLAGEAELALTCWLVGVSRLLPRPLAAVVVGPTASGKSFTLRLTADLFPEEAVHRVTQATPQSWFYLPPGSLRHRFVVMGERPQGETPEVVDANRAWRELVSEGRLVKAVVTKGPDGSLATQLIVQEGPIAYVESTTKTRLFDEDASRLLLLNTDDSQEQTRRVVGNLLGGAGGEEAAREAIRARHHAFQRMIGAKRPRVLVPYGPKLAERLPTDKPECRRLAGHLLSMIEASAIAHQFQREGDGEAIVAAPADYAVAWRLLRGPAARVLGREPHASVRRLVAVLWERFRHCEFTTNEAADAAGVGPRWARQGLRWLVENNLAEETEPARGPRPGRWRLTGTLRETSVLPPHEEVFGI